MVYQDMGAYLLYFDQTKDTLTLKQDHTIINQSLVIPAGFVLRLTEGQSIDFIDDGFIRSYSALEFLGTETMPIHISATGSSQSGIAVIQAESTSFINYTSFDNLTHIEQGAYKTTGALNFYESNVEMDHVVLMNIRSEDGLNVVRSHFNVSNTTFDSTFSDAFDSDFSTGVLSYSLFRNTGNDGFDCSGSDISVNHVDFINIGDKALSIGEHSIISGSYLTLNTMDLGIAVKDGSIAEFNHIEFKNTYVAFVQYNKKLAFGLSSTHLTNVSFEGVIGLQYLIQEEEHLYIDGEVFLPTNLSKSEQIFDALINERPIRS
jgi:hypothetical protein